MKKSKNQKLYTQRGLIFRKNELHITPAQCSELLVSHWLLHVKISPDLQISKNCSGVYTYTAHSPAAKNY